jgi:hypothetical protein
LDVDGVGRGGGVHGCGGDLQGFGVGEGDAEGGEPWGGGDQEVGGGGYGVETDHVPLGGGVSLVVCGGWGLEEDGINKGRDEERKAELTRSHVCIAPASELPGRPDGERL